MKLKLIASLLLLSVMAFANNPLKIQVVDENKEPLTGVKLTLENAENASFTDFDGISVLEGKKEVQIIKVEFAGFETGYIKIVPGSAPSEIEVTLRKK